MHDASLKQHAGYYGKVPTQGDFVTQGLPRTLTDALDLWLREAMRESQRKLGRKWLDAFLVAPVWRMVLGPGVAGPDPVIGVMIPSVDRVGRYFPLVIAARLPGCNPTLETMAQLTPWFDAAEVLALSTLDEGFAIAHFNAATAALELPVSVTAKAGANITGDSFWWNGSDMHEPLHFNGMPPANSFDQHFLTVVETAAKEKPLLLTPQSRVLLVTESAGASLKGSRSPALTEMTVINSDGQAMSVVSGIGTHPGIGAAVQVVADTLARVENPFSMNDLVAEAKGKLGTANTLLRARGAPTEEVFAASVVTLLVQATRYSVLWAGNARAYLLRRGTLTLLTRDHVEARLPNILTRAIGGGANLSLDSAIGQVCEGDRFLLCSAGLPAVLSEDEIANILSTATSARQAATHLTQDAVIAGASLDVTALPVILTARVPEHLPSATEYF